MAIVRDPQEGFLQNLGLAPLNERAIFESAAQRGAPQGNSRAATFAQIGSRAGGLIAPAIGGLASKFTGGTFREGQQRFKDRVVAGELGITPDALRKRRELRQSAQNLKPDPTLDPIDQEIAVARQIAALAQQSGDTEVLGKTLARLSALNSQKQELEATGLKTQLDKQKLDNLQTGSSVDLVIPGRDGIVGGFERKTDGALFMDSDFSTPAPEGTFAINATIQATTVDDFNDLSRRDKSALNRQALEEFNDSGEVRESLSNILPQAIALPGTLGVRGFVASRVGGFVGSIFGDASGDEVSNLISGASQEQIGAMQAQLATIRGRLKPIVTGDEGARVSETEREIAGKIVGLIETLDVSAAYPQVIGALKSLYTESWVSQFNAAKKSEFVNFPVNLRNQEDTVRILSAFANAGFTESEANKALDRLEKIQGNQL